MKRTHVTMAAAAIALMLAATPGVAQQDAEERSVLEGVYTAEQASRGEDIYNQECALCHGPNEFANPGFIRSWNNRTVDNLFTLISSTMPQDGPGRLADDEYIAVISYFFKINGIPDGEEELPTDDEALQRIRIEQADDTDS